ncbi:unnamed protein product [Rotaria sp. Silwood2]|nr:unnamed protein product [Rotaria sp. Silwood2]CAF4349391.1 unnamed protein product [Rotaria sp. Silwood2]
MYSIDRTSPVPIDNHSLMSNEAETEIETSTPELNLLLDKLTEILRFRSSCRRHLGQQQQQQQQQSNPSPITNLKRLQSGSIEPLHNNNNNNNNNNTESSSTGAWKSSISNRSSHHHQHHVINDKKRRLPSLLQRLIDEGNLIKEAVRRLKSQRFSHSFKQQQTHIANTPSTPTTKSSSQTLPNVKLSSASINIPQQISDPPTQTTSSPNRGISWFLSSSVFGTTNHSSGSGSPLRTCCSSSTHDRTPMEIGIHDG